MLFNELDLEQNEEEEESDIDMTIKDEIYKQEIEIKRCCDASAHPIRLAMKLYRMLPTFHQSLDDDWVHTIKRFS
jgi:hypothetical protein